jgi:abequosyltransferase
MSFALTSIINLWSSCTLKLSICIPTYNRAQMLREALWSFLPQLNNEVQIVISDNASTDQTPDVVSEFCKSFANTIYYRCDRNMGADLNYLKVVDLAQADFCWLFGSDDTPSPNAINYVLESITSGIDILLFNRIDCDRALIEIGSKSWLKSPRNFISFTFMQQKTVKEYFQSARSIGSIFSYLSVIVFRRAKWASTTYDTRFTGTAYSHASILLTMLRDGASFRYDSRPIVNCRLGNDSFASDGKIKRILLDLNGYRMIGEVIFQNHPTIQAGIHRILCREYPMLFLIEPLTGLDCHRADDLRSAFCAIGYSRWRWNAALILARIRVPWLHMRSKMSEYIK